MSRPAATIAVALFIVGYGTNVSTPFLVEYRERLDLGDNATQAIFVIYVGGILATLLVAGGLSDRVGRRLVFIPSLAFSALASVLLIIGRDSFGFLLAGRVLLGVVSGASLGVGAAWLQELMGPGQELRAAMITTVATYGGFGAGPPLSALYELIGPAPLVVPFVAHIVLALAAIAPVLAVPDTAPARGSGGLRLRFGVPHSARRGFVLTIVPVAVLVFSFPSTGFSLFPVLVSDAVGNDVLVAGVAGMTTAWSGLLARPVMRRLAPHPSLVVGAAIGTAGLLLGIAAYTTDLWPLVWPSALLLGAASGLLSTAGLTLVGAMAEGETRGALSSTFYFLAYIGMSTPLVVTAIGQLIGVTTTLVILTAFAASIVVTAPARHRLAA